MFTYDADYEIEKTPSGKIVKITNIYSGKEVTLVWPYPVKVGVWGGEPDTLYFPTAAERNAWMKGRDYCEKLPRRKVYSDMVRGDVHHDDYWKF